MKHTPIGRITGWGLLTVAVLVIGCSSSPPVAFYTLNPQTPASRGLDPPTADPGLVVGVGPVTFPEFLDRPQIVTRPGPNRLKVSEFHRWGGSLQESLPRVLSENIAVHLGTDQVAVYPWKERLKPSYRVTVAILQLDGRLGDAVNLVATWRIFQPPGNTVLAMHRSAIHTPVNGEGYEEFVAAQSRAVDTLAQAIAQKIAEFSQAQPSEK